MDFVNANQVFLLKDFDDYWNWDHVTAKENGYEYMGYLNKLSKEDFEKMEMIRTANKYNL